MSRYLHVCRFSDVATYSGPCRKYADPLLLKHYLIFFFFFKRKGFGEILLESDAKISFIYCVCSSAWAAIGNNWYIFLNTVVFGGT